VVTTHKPTRGTGVVLPKQLRGPAKGDPPIRFALAGFAVSRDKEERVQRCVTCHQVGDVCSKGRWWECSLYKGDMAQERQAKRVEERRPKTLTVDDLFMDLATMKASEEAQSEEWGGDKGQQQKQQPTQSSSSNKRGRPSKRGRGNW
jgi:hypothetical protein